jgi:hypothetical protein
LHIVEGAVQLKALWLLLAYLCCVVGFGWLALSMDVHWQQVRRVPSVQPRTALLLRVLGGLALLLSLLSCLRADHASMAALVWVLMLAAAALTVAFALTWRPRWLVLLVPLGATTTAAQPEQEPP